MTIPEVLDLLIAPAQHWVGTQWESGAWNVAQEHLATAIAARTVDALPVADSRTSGPVLITCAEGEWHTLELSMVSVGLQSQGYETVTVGAPLPSGQLVPLLHELAPLCVTVSCQMPGNLPGARRMAATARGAGTPVVMGGSAITKGRAKHLGANAHARDIRDLSQAIESAQRPVEAIEPLTHGRSTGFEWLDLRIPKLAAQLSDPNKNLSTEAVLDGVWMLRCLSAALLCDEPAILKTQADWQQRRSEVAGNPTASDLLRAVLAVVDSGPPIVVETLTEGAGCYLG
jgi:methanogenic corrinoid protein MtbC1